MTKNQKSRARALNLKIEALQTELVGCTTAAMEKCVLETLADARRQLAEITR